MSKAIFNGIKPIVTFVLGPPGSGKGTQCKLICDEFGFTHLSAGDLLRAERNCPESKYGEMIEQHIQEGKIVPVKVTCSLIERAMIKQCEKLAEKFQDAGDDKSKLRGKFLIDGFPRNQDNLQGWNSEMSSKVEVAFVLFLDCPTDTCVERCLKRGQSGSNRSDDNEQSLRKRLVTYNECTMPILNHFSTLNLVKRVDALISPKKVYQEVRKLFQEIQ